MELKTYLGLARARNDAPSDRRLATLLGLSNTALWYWRIGKQLPAPRTMLRLAALAGVERQRALSDLMEWKLCRPGRLDGYRAGFGEGGTAEALPPAAVPLTSLP